MKTVVRPETEMKESGLQWLGEIPNDWKVSRVGNFFSFSSGDSLTNEEIRDEGMYLVYGANGIRGYYSKYNLAEKRILLGRVGALAGNVHIVDGKVWVTEHALIASNKLDLVEEYYGYVFESMNLIQYSKSSAQPVISGDTLQKLRFPVPKLSEQQAIADYLDETCSKIDEIIAEAKASIDEYKELKQSVIFEAVTKGLDKNVEEKECQMVSLQQIPKHWKECRMGTIYRESKEAGRTDLPILMISINTGISDGEVGDEERLRKVVRSEDKSVYKVVHKNDLAYNMMRAWQGGFGAAQVDGLVSPAYVVATPRTELDSRYIEALLRTPMFTEKIRGLSYGIADFRLRLYWNYFKDLKICLPPVDEQRKIADFIDEQNKMIEGLISEKQSLIADLEAYKKSLIYEVVTGKRRVV